MKKYKLVINDVNIIINKINNKSIDSHSLSYFLIGNYDKSKEDKKNIIKEAIKHRLVSKLWINFHLDENIYNVNDINEILLLI